MEDYYFIGEIRAFPYYYRLPESWLPCDGRILSVSQFTPLYGAIGRIYTASGISNSQFALPNLQGLVPINYGTGNGLTPCTMGRSGGQESDKLTINNISHSHTLTATITGDMSAYNGKGNAPTITGAQSYSSKVAIGGANGQGVLSTSLATATIKGVTSGTAIAPVCPSVTNPTGMDNTPQNPLLPFSDMQPFMTMQYFICTDGMFPLREN
jgi:microcystin-dependent protein